ncbi:MAG: transglycosylase domain-containing protein, partial [Clostridia bacterium]|nr:transglycosylase domain-containing protein [Clostridia bacterium]
MSTAFFTVYFSARLDNTVTYGETAIKVMDNVGEEIPSPSSVRIYIKYDEISPHIINAFVALEDKRFFKHSGIDYIRIGGALINNIKAGYIKEGGSTITQQLAKNTQLSNKKTLQRKIKEAKLARDIERKYSKEEILEIYLNAIYFGNSIYGINEACMRFFNKKPADIELYEAAILAGVVKNPGKNSPLRSPANANQRKNLVLRLMKEQGYIDAFQYEK